MQKVSNRWMKVENRSYCLGTLKQMEVGCYVDSTNFHGYFGVWMQIGVSFSYHLFS